jgi:hypothetical protein
MKGFPDACHPAVLPDGPVCLAEFASLIGQPVSRFSAEARQGPARVIRPGRPVTMDYNPLRLNVLLDADDRIVGLSCG